MRKSSKKQRPEQYKRMEIILQLKLYLSLGMVTMKLRLWKLKYKDLGLLKQWALKTKLLLDWVFRQLSLSQSFVWMADRSRIETYDFKTFSWACIL